MRKEFQIYVHRNSDNLHLKLKGDFDDSSANELIDVLEEKSGDVSNVYVHTSNLNDISSSGIEMFRKGLERIKRFVGNVKFTGENANYICLESSYMY